MNQYKVTFIYRGFIAGVFYNKSKSEKEAIKSAKLYINKKWSTVRAEIINE